MAGFGLCCYAQPKAGQDGTINGMENHRRNGVDVKLTKAKAAKAAVTLPEFNAQTFLDSVGIAKTVVKYGRGEAIFTQGESCEHVLYIQSGGVKLSVLSKTGKEAVVAMLGPGDFFGEGCLAGQALRMGSATAITPSAILRVRKRQMAELLHKQSTMSDRFITHMLTRNIRIEEDLIDQLFNSSEKRLARTPPCLSTVILLEAFPSPTASPAAAILRLVMT